MREFSTGATRDTAEDKPDYRGFLSPEVLRRFGQYMLKHQVQADGTIRPSDNWKRGIPQKEYLSSLLRHVIGVWDEMEDTGVLSIGEEALQDHLCAIFFNTQGLLRERLLRRDVF